jgi:hypothetical protein
MNGRKGGSGTYVVVLTFSISWLTANGGVRALTTSTLLG